MEEALTSFKTRFTKEINVEEAFKAQDLPTAKTYQPLDYTAFPSGDVKIGHTGIGFISQEGLHKRAEDIASLKNTIAKDGIILSYCAKIPVGKGESAPSSGILAVVDKFFNALNRLLGE